jgi:COX assembly protein 1
MGRHERTKFGSTVQEDPKAISRVSRPQAPRSGFLVQLFRTLFMNALSRREEDTLLKTTKARALTECDSIVKGMSACSTYEAVRILMSVRIRGLCNWTHAVCCVGL